MWIFLNDSFLSIVADRGNPKRLLVRSRFKDDIEQVFPNAKVTHTPKADYLYRAFIARKRVAMTIKARLSSIDYPNFKDSIDEQDRHTAYYDVYDTLAKAAR